MSDLDPNGFKVTNLGNPKGGGDGANKMYADLLAGGIASKTALEATPVPSNVDRVRIAGHSTVDDGGAATYNRVASQPAHPGWIQSADAAWWEIDTNNLLPE